MNKPRLGESAPRGVAFRGPTWVRNSSQITSPLFLEAILSLKEGGSKPAAYSLAAPAPHPLLCDPRMPMMMMNKSIGGEGGGSINAGA